MKQIQTNEQIKTNFPNFNLKDINKPNILTNEDDNLEELYSKVEGETVSKEDPFNEYKFGDTIQFISGQKNNILYQSKIYAFETKDEEGRVNYLKEGMLYVYKDAYWFPIKRDTIIKRS